MDENWISGTAKNIGGKIEEGAGAVVGNAKAQFQGKLDQAAGTAQDLYGQAADTARESAAGFDKWIRTTIETQPYTPPPSPSVSAGCSVACTGRYKLQHGRRSAPLTPRAFCRWPLLCSALLVGAVFAAEIGRLYRVQSRSRQPATSYPEVLKSPRSFSADGPSSPVAAGMPPRLGKSHSKVGKISCGGPTNGSGKIAFWLLPPGSCFTGCWRSFPRSRRWFRSMVCSRRLRLINEHLSAVAGLLPEGGVSIVRDQVDRLAAKGDAKLGFGFVIGLGIALWSANSGMKAILDALNVVYEEKEKRGFIKLTLISFCFTLAAIAAVLLSLGAVVIMPIALNYLGLHAVTDSSSERFGGRCFWR